MDQIQIKNLNDGEAIKGAFIISAVSARETKTKKPYLALTLSDGVSTIDGNYWDWAGAKKPDIGSIYNLSAEVSSWQGKLQLNIKSIVHNTTLTPEDFIISVVDEERMFTCALKLINEIDDKFLQKICYETFIRLKHLWLVVPGAKTVHHAFKAGTLVHSLSVAFIARSISEMIDGSDEDLCTAGALLHDVGKLFTYEYKGAAIEISTNGMMKDHLFMGAEFVGNFCNNIFPAMDKAMDEKLELLRHIILSHHGTQEHGAVVPPICLEAHIVHHADAIDAAAEMIRKASGDTAWTEPIWALNNRKHLSTGYISNLMDNRNVCIDECKDCTEENCDCATNVAPMVLDGAGFEAIMHTLKTRDVDPSCTMSGECLDE